MRPFERVYGVDFSGAKLAGRNAWVARCDLDGDRPAVRELDSLEKLTGAAERDAALAGLVTMIRKSDAALWGIDFPFALPIELGFGDFGDQLAKVAAWPDGAYAFGVHCLETARATLGRGHVRRQTDVDERAPFDCYHYPHHLPDVPRHEGRARPAGGGGERLDPAAAAAGGGGGGGGGGVPEQHAQAAGAPAPELQAAGGRAADAGAKADAAGDPRRAGGSRRLQRPRAAADGPQPPAATRSTPLLAAVGVWNGWQSGVLSPSPDRPRDPLEGRIAA